MADPRTDSLARLCAAIEHTLLAPQSGARDVEVLCDEALSLGVRGVCVAPRHVALARRRLDGSGARVVSVVGFPLGSHRSEVKAHEAKLAAEDGADELDVVMDLASAREGRWARVQQDVQAVVLAAGGLPVKLILETALLEDAQKAEACRCALLAGAAFVKTSTGFAARGATLEDVRLLRSAVGSRAGVKASGGIRDAAWALALLDAGADRLGTSAMLRIVTQLRDPDMLPPRQGE